MEREKVLGVGVDHLTKKETLAILEKWIEAGGGCKQVVTAYSEFFIKALEDEAFRKIMNRADLVVPDGGSVLVALEYKRRVSSIKNLVSRIMNIGIGLGVGWKLWKGELGETVTGVWLFEELVGLAAEKGWKVFLLGGYGDVSAKLAHELSRACRQAGVKRQELRVESCSGEPYITNGDAIEKINKFMPDILFVAYGPVKQEKWIAKHKGELKVKIAIGVGGTFDEVLGSFPRPPEFFTRHGLKWLWRLMVQPKRMGRIWRGVVMFPWLVFRKS